MVSSDVPELIAYWLLWSQGRTLLSRQIIKAMKQRFLQSLADFTINKLAQANDEDTIKVYVDFGHWLDNLAINYFDIYLD